MKPFDPFTSTFDQAEKEPGAFEPQGAMQQFLAAHGLLENRAFYEANPLDGIASCCTAGLAPPEWLARAFLRRFQQVRGARASSWDDAFGAPWPKNVQLPAVRRRELNRMKIGNLVADFVKRHPSLPMTALWSQFGRASARRGDVDEGIAERARRIPVSKSTAQSLYAEAVAAGLAIDHNDMRKRLLAPAERAQWQALTAALREFPRSRG